ncbi:MAG: methylmalonyl Co-A mutase-associated GTPase MeaB [Balneolaceae bacterium]
MDKPNRKNKKDPSKSTPLTSQNEGVKESINPHYQRQKPNLPDVDEFIEGIRSGNRTLLSQAITLIESSNNENQRTGQQILERCIGDTGNSLRIGITGVPGVGKSTFIETLGTLIMEKGHRLAVLAVDPSSGRSKGSILGDKTRMQKLANHPNAYVRPSPASGTLGGVARTSRETMLLCEAAGFDTVVVETVGVGQSETTVHSMVDFFLLLMLAGAGDELQGIKRGIIEMADLIAINKADRENVSAANKARNEYENALSILTNDSSEWKPTVLTCSALEGTGISEIWDEIERYVQQARKSSRFSTRRSEQVVRWMYENLNRQLKDRFYHHPEIKNSIKTFEEKVEKGKMNPFKAAEELLKKLKL